MKINYLNNIKQPQPQWFFYKFYKLEFGQNNPKTQPLTREYQWLIYISKEYLIEL